MQELKLFIKGLYSYSKQFKGLDMKPTKKNCVGSIETNGKVLPIHYLPDMNKVGIAFGALSYNCFTGKAIIMVDDNFYTLDEAQRAAMLSHECGHYNLGHCKRRIKDIWDNFVFLGKLQEASDDEKNLLVENTMKNRDYTQELEADAHAVSKCGQDAVVSMLEALYKATYNPEISHRYKYVTGETLSNPLADMLKNVFEQKAISVDELFALGGKEGVDENE